MRQHKQVNLNPQFYTSAGTGFAATEFPTKDKGAGPYAGSRFSVSQWLPHGAMEGVKKFDEAFLKLTGARPAYHAMEAYAGLLTAAAAINKANSAQPAAIRDAPEGRSIFPILRSDQLSSTSAGRTIIPS